MSEMTDTEVESRLARYRKNRKIRRIAAVAGAVLALVLVVGGVAHANARAERERIAVLEKKPLREWTAEEQTKYNDLYETRLKNEPLSWRGLFTTGVYSPIGDTTIKGIWIKKFFILTAFLTVLSWLCILLGLRAHLLWIAAYLCSSLFGLFVFYLLVLWLWKLLVQ